MTEAKMQQQAKTQHLTSHSQNTKQNFTPTQFLTNLYFLVPLK